MLNVNGVAEAPAAPAHGQTGGSAGGPARPSGSEPAGATPAPRPGPRAARPSGAAAAAASGPRPDGPTIQLGAFSSPAAANSAWRALAGRFRYLAPLAHNVVPVQVGGRTLHRLRACGPDSASVCRRLQAAGEACTMVN